jgi:polyphosphate kinase
VRFNERVLEEAADDSHRLLERLKFIAIFSSNLDEFFMVRVAGLKEQETALGIELSPDGLTPTEQIHQLAKALPPLLEKQTQLLVKDILPKLADFGLSIKLVHALTAQEVELVEQYFHAQVYPLLTPIAIDSAHPMPKLRTLGLNFYVDLTNPSEPQEQIQAVIPVPANVPRFFQVPTAIGQTFIALEQLIEPFIHTLFPKMIVNRLSLFRVTRNADLDISEAEADDLLKTIERELIRRRLGEIVRLEVDHRMPEEDVEYLREEFNLNACDVYRISGPYLGLEGFSQLVFQVDRPDLKDNPFVPARHPDFIPDVSRFRSIKRKDILLYHPYDTFDHTLEVIEEAAEDDQVLAIKQTLYRTGGQSPIVRALRKAVDNGKQVTVVIEIKARFDEAVNITWAKELEKAGAHVVYGKLGLKTHCKTTLILRREGDTIQPYVHLSSGNYNEKTARFYTDLALWTADPEIGRDVAELFNYLTGHSLQDKWKQLWIAPLNLRQNILRTLRACSEAHTDEHPSRVFMVMNSLVDPEIIKELYFASKAGVGIDLVVRGICCLAPGKPGASENIRVRSIVGRFLEHCRIYRFVYGDHDLVYVGSADMMSRNLNRRVEVVFPIREPELKKQCIAIIETMLKDNTKARLLQSTGMYVRAKPQENEPLFAAQSIFLSQARQKASGKRQG